MFNCKKCLHDIINAVNISEFQNILNELENLKQWLSEGFFGLNPIKTIVKQS